MKTNFVSKLAINFSEFDKEIFFSAPSGLFFYWIFHIKSSSMLFFFFFLNEVPIHTAASPWSSTSTSMKGCDIDLSVRIAPEVIDVVADAVVADAVVADAVVADAVVADAVVADAAPAATAIA